MNETPKRPGRPRKHPADAPRCRRCERVLPEPGLCDRCRPKDLERKRKARVAATPEQRARDAERKRLKREQAKEKA